MTNTPLRGQLSDAIAGREPLAAEDEERFQSWARRQPWFMSEQNRTGFEPDLRKLDFDPRSLWEAQHPQPVQASADADILVGGALDDTLQDEADDALPVRRLKAMARHQRGLGVKYHKYADGEKRVAASEDSLISDCTGLVQQWLESEGHHFPSNLTTATIPTHPQFEQVVVPQPGDVILQKGHAGIFTGMKNGKPRGLQLGERSGFKVLDWGPQGVLPAGDKTTYHRPNPPRR